MKHWLLILLPSLAMSQGNLPVLSLDEALSHGRKDNPSLLKVRSQTVQSREVTAQSTAALWPTLSVLSDLSRLGPNLAGDPVSNPAANGLKDNQWTTTFSARWIVFDGFATRSVRTARQAQEKLASARETGQELSLSSQIAIGYIEVMRHQRLLTTRTGAIEVSQERLALAQARAQVGTASLLDEQQAQMDANADSSAWLKQNLALSQARRQLNWLMGRDPELLFQVTDSLPTGIEPVREELLQAALENSPTLAQARASEAAALSEEKAGKAEFLPVASLYSNYVFLNQLRDSHPPANAYWQGFKFGAQVSMPLFEGGKSLAKSRASYEASRQASLGVREVQQQIRRDFAQGWMAMEQAQANHALERRNATLSASTLALALGRHRAGSLSGMDLRRIQEASVEAESRAISAACDARIARIQLALLAGRFQP